MKVLVVCTRRDYASFTEYMAPFIYEQVQELRKMGNQVEVLLIEGGVKGYAKAIGNIKKRIKVFQPDIVHAHYGLCGVMANIQRRVPVVTTYHGSDLNNRKLSIVSNIAVLLSRANVVVSAYLREKMWRKKNAVVIPCGINGNLLVPMPREEARRNLGWPDEKKYILFSKEFNNTSKNYPLARAAVDLYNERYEKEHQAELLEFIGYSREQVLWLYNAVDCVIMTSNNEGSPQFIKEAMACNCPIVSVDVGDVKDVISDTPGCYLAERDPKDLAIKLEQAISFGRTNGRQKVMENYESSVIAEKVKEVYNNVLNHQ